MSEWRLRLAVLDDASAIAALAQQTFCDTFNHYQPEDRAAHLAQYYMPHVFASQMEHGKTDIWLAEAGGALVAYTQIGAYKLPLAPHALPVIELYKLYVHRDWKGRKIGDALLNKTLAIAQTRQARGLYLGVWEGNVNAQRFYARYGFEKIGEYDYPPIGQIVDREWIMRKAL